jgi:hypothetical protein
MYAVDYLSSATIQLGNTAVKLLRSDFRTTLSLQGLKAELHPSFGLNGLILGSAAAFAVVRVALGGIQSGASCWSLQRSCFYRPISPEPSDVAGKQSDRFTPHGPKDVQRGDLRHFAVRLRGLSRISCGKALNAQPVRVFGVGAFFEKFNYNERKGQIHLRFWRRSY